MGPKTKKSWEKLNSSKREFKKRKTESKLKKTMDDTESKLKKTMNDTIPNEHSSEIVLKSVSTLSIAVPSSILDNAQSPELRTYLAGQIARAACIYQVDEIIVFNDMGDEENAYSAAVEDKKKSKSCEHFATLLQYLECPQYLRKHLFPIHNFLKYAGVLNPLDAPHHLRKDDTFHFREGIVLTLPPKPEKGSYVDVGLMKPVIVDRILEPYFRVTVKLNVESQSSSNTKYGTIVSPSTPKQETGRYWGYTVRVANSLNEIFTKSTYPGGYDLTIGTSDKGIAIDEIDCSQKKYSHCLIAFGGLQGLEFALDNDNALKIDDVSLLFDHYVNTCPEQGCRTIRTEEALLISLAELRSKLRTIVFDESALENSNNSAS